ncbi:MAG: flagellar motor switch protein FliN [Hydrogenobaculum sp.]
MAEEKKQDQQPEEIKEEENKVDTHQNDEDLMKLWEEAMRAQAQTESTTENQQPQATVEEQDVSKELQRILDIPLSITVVIGTTVITIKELLNLRPGSVVALDETINSFVSVYANGKLIAKAELVVVGENFGIRIAEIIEKEERVKSLASR